MYRVLLDPNAISETTDWDVVALLQDAQLSSLVQFGPDPPSSIVDRVADSRAKAAVRAALVRLRDRNRLLTCADIGVAQPCGVAPFVCAHERAFATVLVAAQPGFIDGLKIYGLQNYLAGPLHPMLTNHDYSILDRAPRRTWEDRVWRPLLTAARSATIIDYLAGDNCREFANTFAWLKDQFSLSSVYPVSVTLYSSCSGNSQQIRGLCKELGWTLKLREYRANTNDSLPHDRYIITDRLGVQVGRGFNLCTGGVSEIRDSAIYVCGDPASVINKANRAPRVTKL